MKLQICGCDRVRCKHVDFFWNYCAINLSSIRFNAKIYSGFSQLSGFKFSPRKNRVTIQDFKFYIIPQPIEKITENRKKHHNISHYLHFLRFELGLSLRSLNERNFINSMSGIQCYMFSGAS